jgi:hypothetical protein
MIYLVVKSSDQTRTNIKSFERFLQAHNLKLLKYWDGKGSFELGVNAEDPEKVRWVNHLAIDFFNGDLVSLRTEIKDPAEANMISGSVERTAENLLQ